MPEIPHLKTQLKGPLLELEKHLLDKQTIIEKWFRDQANKYQGPVYCSIDIRNAGFKVAPVDTNLFSAGFNNLNPDFMPLCIQAAQTMMNERMPNCTSILIIPENHTRNLFYLESLKVLQDIFQRAGYSVRIGSLIEELKEPQRIDLPSGKPIVLEPVIRKDNRIQLKDFSPCLLLLNNDLSAGIPDILRDIKQPILPPLDLGWSERLKSEHFHYYEVVTREFAELIGIDPWLINPLFLHCGEINFMNREGEACLIDNAEKLFARIKEKYREHNVQHDPFIVVKADAGTYGMGVMVVKSVDELRDLNRKQRTRMSMAKGGQPISKVIIQEGVHTFEEWEGAAAEPVVYMIGRHVVGGFYRVHTKKGAADNLNAPGMDFKPLAFSDCCIDPYTQLTKHERINRFYIYGVIARLARLAAAREL